MNEIKLIEEIEDAIHNTKYDELLYKIELKLKKMFYKYTTEDVLALINRTIIFHNYNINCKEENYSEYQRDKHVSLKILLSCSICSNQDREAIYFCFLIFST